MGAMRSLSKGAGAVRPFINAVRGVERTSGENLGISVIDGDPVATAHLRDILGVENEPAADAAVDPVVYVAVPHHDPTLAATVLARARRQGRRVAVIIAADAQEGKEIERLLLTHPPLELSNIAHVRSLDDVEFVRMSVATLLGDDALAVARTHPALRDAVGDILTVQAARRAGAIGIAGIVKAAQLPVIAALQARLVAQIASMYGRPLDARRGLEIAGVVASAFGWRAVARRAVRTVPVAAFAVRGGVAYAGTRVIGEAAQKYFQAAGDKADVPLDGLASAISGALQKRKDT